MTACPVEIAGLDKWLPLPKYVWPASKLLSYSINFASYKVWLVFCLVSGRLEIKMATGPRHAGTHQRRPNNCGLNTVWHLRLFLHTRNHLIFNMYVEMSQVASSFQISDLLWTHAHNFSYQSSFSGHLEYTHFSSTDMSLAKLMLRVYVVKVLAAESTIDSSITHADAPEPPTNCVWRK